MKKKNFQIIDNNGKRFNVKFLLKKTVPLNESPKTTQVDYGKLFHRILAWCGIIPDRNHTF